MLHDWKKVVEGEVHILKVYSMMISRVIMRFVMHGCDDIVRNAGNMVLLLT